MVNRRLVFFFLLVLLWHLAHVFEEIWGGFWMIDRLGGLGRFLIVNEILFSLPVVLLYFVLQQRRWAFRLSIVYGAVMIVNGLGHYLGTWLTGRYFGGFSRRRIHRNRAGGDRRPAGLLFVASHARVGAQGLVPCHCGPDAPLSQLAVGALLPA